MNTNHKETQMQSAALKQLLSLTAAINGGKGWTSDELQFVAGTLSDPILDVADVLGRTYYSVATIRKLMGEGVELKGSDRLPTAPRKIEVICLECYTAVTPAGTCLC